MSIEATDAIVADPPPGGSPVFYLVKPPEDVDYTRYRTLQREGKLQSVLFTVIPYSPTDRLRDLEDARLQRPAAAHWLGTDTNGADVLSNLVHASRIAL